MHHLTRSTLAACAVILSIGAAVGLANLAASNASNPAEPVTPARQHDPPALGIEPRLSQRAGEWSPICATTQEPLVDFSPVDYGTGRHRILLTVHNCSAQPVELTEPLMWFGGREGLSDYLRFDTDRTDLTPLTLPAWESAQLVLTWEADGVRATENSETLSVRVPGIGEGELTDTLDLDLTSRAWVSGWTR